MTFASRFTAIAITTIIVNANPGLANDARILEECRYLDTEIVVGFEADLAAKTISLSGLKGCDLTTDTDKAMTGACIDPRFRGVSFNIEYDKSTHIGRWWIEVEDKPVTDADGKFVDFAYNCGAAAK